MQPGLGLRDGLLGTVIEGTGGLLYHLRQLIGEGGQGWVYKANYDDPGGFWVVVKVLRSDAVDAVALKRFQREADVLRRLSAVPLPNPNIVRFYDCGVHTARDGGGVHELPFIALEHVEGQTLGKLIQAHGGFGLPAGRVRRVMKQVARALTTMHDERIVHRDLKPSNILLAQRDGQETAKVTDFGLVKLPELSVLKTAALAGATLGYAPPEQYENGNNRVSIQTDVFSFAAVLYEMLAGVEAFPSRPNDNPFVIVARMLSAERPALGRVVATLPRELRDRPTLTAVLDRELARALSADPAVRHGSIAQLWRAVDPVLRDAAGEGAPPELGATAAESGAVVKVSKGSEVSMTNLEGARGATAAGTLGRLSAPSQGSLGGAARAAIAAPMPDWRVLGRPMTGELLRAVTAAVDGRSLIAVGAHGLYHFARGVWSVMNLPTGVEPRFIRGVARLPDGALLLYGDGGFALSLSPAGLSARIPTGDRDLTLLAAHADAGGIAFAGERLSRPVGVAVEIRGGGAPVVHTLEGTGRLYGVTRLGAASLVVCGANGALFELGGTRRAPREIAWGRTGHLFAVAAAPDGGAFAAGSGGHALRISSPPLLPGLDAPPVATLEAVQTTRDLTHVSVDPSGVAWAVGGQARLLQRRSGVWTRIPLDPSAQGPLVAAWSRPTGLTVIVADGTVFEAPPLEGEG